MSHDFLVDAALAQGTGQRPIAAVFATEPAAAHRKGVEFVSQVMLEILDEPVEAVITTASGYPVNLTFCQAIKGITAEPLTPIWVRPEQGRGRAKF